MSDGWVIVGTIAQVMSLATLIFAAYELGERKRRFPSVFLRFDVVAWRDSPDSSRVWIAEVSNIGSGSCFIGVLVLLKAQAVLSWDHRVRYALGPGQFFTLEFTAPDINEAWVFFQYASTADRREVVYEWQPLSSSGTAHGAFELAISKTRSPKPWDRVIRRRPKPAPVGPGGIARVSQLVSQAEDEAGMSTIFSITKGVEPRSTLSSVFSAPEGP